MDIISVDGSPSFRGVIGDCTRDTLKVIDPRTVDVIVTSPPYKEKDGYSKFLMHGVAVAASKVMKNNGLIFMNFGQLSECPERPFEAMMCFLENGFVLRQTIIWEKSRITEEVMIGKDGSVILGDDSEPVYLPVQRGHFQPINSDYLLNYCHEYVFVMERSSKSKRKFDRLSIGLSYTDKSNLDRGTRGKHGDLHCAGDVWWIPYKTTGPHIKKMHCQEYPIDLPLRCLKVSGLRKGIVWDPFMGSGSTAAASKTIGVNFIGHDIREEMVNLARDRWVSME